MTENALYPLHVFRFQVDFRTDPLTNSGGSSDVALCSGSFAECTGIEATMEPKVIKEGGRNYGAAQRAGPVTFATVILKRGMTSTRDLWNWFDLLSGQSKYAYRLAAVLSVLGSGGEPALVWRLDRAMPVKFKVADLNARATEVGVEELHLAHEGLRLVRNVPSAL
jgi:phage tail-like protein